MKIFKKIKSFFTRTPKRSHSWRVVEPVVFAGDVSGKLVECRLCGAHDVEWMGVIAKMFTMQCPERCMKVHNWLEWNYQNNTVGDECTKANP